MLELLRHPTPELPYTLKDVIAIRIWEYRSYCSKSISEQSHIPSDRVAMFAKCCQWADFLMDQPGNLPAIQGKLLMKFMVGG